MPEKKEQPDFEKPRLTLFHVLIAIAGIAAYVAIPVLLIYVVLKLIVIFFK